MVVKTYAVQQRLVLRQPEQARLRITELRPGRHRPDFHEAEAEHGQLVGQGRILVKLCCQPHRVGKFQPENLAFKAGVLELVECSEQGRRARHPRGAAQVVENEVVGALRIEVEEEGFDESFRH